MHVAGNLLTLLGERQGGTCYVRTFAQLNQVREAQKTQQRRADKESNASVRGEIETAHSNECQPADCAHRRRDGQSQTVRGNRAKNPERHKVHAEAQQNYVYVTRGQHRHTYQRQNHQCRPDDASTHRGGDRHQPRYRVRRAVHHREQRNQRHAGPTHRRQFRGGEEAVQRHEQKHQPRGAKAQRQPVHVAAAFTVEEAEAVLAQGALRGGGCRLVLRVGVFVLVGMGVGVGFGHGSSLTCGCRGCRCYRCGGVSSGSVSRCSVSGYGFRRSLGSP